MKYARLMLLALPLLFLAACGENGGDNGDGSDDSFAITTNSIDYAFVDVNFGSQLNTQNGTDPVTFDWATAYTPPAWLSLSTDGQLTGAPTNTGTFNLEVEATDSSATPQTATRTLLLEVLDRPVITTTDIPRAIKGTAYSEQLAYTSPAIVNPTFQLASGSTLPTGFGVNSAGVIGGTTSDGGLFVIDVELLVGATVVDTVTLDLVVYESIPYTYVEDSNESPTPNDSTGDATQLLPGATPPGRLTMNETIIQSTPLTLNSDQNIAKPDPDDYLKFNIGNTGTIKIEVFFRGLVGEVDAYLWHYNGSTHQVSVVASSTGHQTDDETIVLHNAPLSFPGAGYYYLQVHAPFDAAMGLWNRNAYTFRITFNDLTIATDSLEADSSGGSIDEQVVATNAGNTPTSPTFSIVNGTLPNGVTFTTDGRFTGTPTEFGLYDFTVQVEDGGLVTERDIKVRFFDSSAGDYWQIKGDRLLHDATNGDSEFEAWGDAMVVAPHPEYPTEGAIYVIGGHSGGLLDMVRVFHTDRAGIPADKQHKFEDIGKDLPVELRYHGAKFVQHSYGGYIYVVGGELAVQPGAHTLGHLTRGVYRLQVADGSGDALSHPLSTSWETVAELPDTAPGGEDIRGWAEFGLAVDDQPNDSDDRIYLLGGRYDLEDSVGAGTYSRTFHDAVLMFELPTSAAGPGTWHWKNDTAPYTPRRFPAVAMFGDYIYVVAGREGSVGATGSGSVIADYIEMYQPDNFQSNGALSTAGSGSFGTMSGGGGYYPMYATINGSLYVWCGWDSNFQGTKALHRFDPSGGGIGGTVTRLTDADWGTGFGGGVAHDGKLWIISGIGHGVEAEPKNLVYNP